MTSALARARRAVHRIRNAHLVRRIREADLSVGAAAAAYNAFLALVPLSLALMGVAAIIGGDQEAVDRVERALLPMTPEPVVDFVVSLMIDADERIGGGEAWFIAVSCVVALFLGSRAVVALKRGLALVGEATESRPALQARLVGAALTAGGGLTLLFTSVMLVVGRHIFLFLEELSGWGAITDLWVWLRIPVSGIGIFVFLLALYTWGPPQPVPRARLAALIATTGILLGSLGFGLYLATTPALGATFGMLGAVAIAMVWLYLGALSILAAAVVAHTVAER
jgi:membrane protein